MGQRLSGGLALLDQRKLFAASTSAQTNMFTPPFSNSSIPSLSISSAAINSAYLLSGGKSVAAHPALQHVQACLELGDFLLLFHCALLQRLDCNHQDSIEVAGADGGGRSNGSDGIVTTGSPTGIDPAGTTWIGCCLD